MLHDPRKNDWSTQKMTGELHLFSGVCMYGLLK